MRIIVRKPGLRLRSKALSLAAVISLLTASSALAAVFSLNLEQGNKVQNDKIIGEWDMYLAKGDDETFEGSAVLIIKAEGDRLTGKAIYTINGATHEYPLVDLKFDGEKFLFKIDCGQDCDDEKLECYLKFTNDQFEGPAKYPKRELNARMRLVRKK